MNDDHPMAHELLKIATCIIVENPEELLDKLPLDIQVTYRAYINFVFTLMFMYHVYIYKHKKSDLNKCKSGLIVKWFLYFINKIFSRNIFL